MIIIGVDYHPEFQQIATVDTETGEFEEQRLQHREEAESFYRELAERGVAVRVGMEASGHARDFGKESGFARKLRGNNGTNHYRYRSGRSFQPLLRTRRRRHSID